MWFALALETLVAMVIAYFCGSLLFGLWVGQNYRGVDIRAHGSGNAGATNAARVLGPRLGALVFALDTAKGLAPTLLLPWFFGLPTGGFVQLAIGLSAVAGHVFSWMSGFKGGKGVATALGVFLAIATVPILVTLAIGTAVIFATGYVSAVSVTSAVVFPILLWWFHYPASVIAISGAICFILIVKHESNLLRLMAGTERKLWDKAAPDGTLAAAGSAASPPLYVARPFDPGDGGG